MYCAVCFCRRFSFLRRYFWITKPVLSHCSPVLIKASHSQKAARTKIRMKAVCWSLKCQKEVVCDRFYSPKSCERTSNIPLPLVFVYADDQYDCEYLQEGGIFILIIATRMVPYVIIDPICCSQCLQIFGNKKLSATHSACVSSFILIDGRVCVVLLT